MEINQQNYPTMDPLKQEGRIKSASTADESPRKERSLHATISSCSPTKQSDTNLTNIHSTETIGTLTLNSSMGMNCIDNRFPSSPVSVDTDHDI